MTNQDDVFKDLTEEQKRAVIKAIDLAYLSGFRDGMRSISSGVIDMKGADTLPTPRGKRG